MQRILKEPLLHFVALGCALFALFVAMNRSEGSSNVITVSAAQQQQLAASFSRAWRRPPSEVEFKGLVDDWVREELANREATAMGLGDSDLVIRRRLRQKYETLMEQFDASIEPTNAQLRDWFSTHAARYEQPATYSLQHIFFSTDTRANALQDAQDALTLLAQQPAASAASLGDPIALPREFEEMSTDGIAARLGEEFSIALENLPHQRWSGPITSAFGVHLVLITASTKATLPELESVRREVEMDWRSDQLRSARENRYARLLENYAVEIEPVMDETDTAVGDG